MSPGLYEACAALIRAGRADLATALEVGTKTAAGVLLELRRVAEPSAELLAALEAGEAENRIRTASP